MVDTEHVRPCPVVQWDVFIHHETAVFETDIHARLYDIVTWLTYFHLADALKVLNKSSRHLNLVVYAKSAPVIDA